MACVSARMEEEKREMSYRYYVTDSLHYLNQHKYMSMRWVDMINPPEPIDPKEAELVAIRTIENAKKFFGGNTQLNEV